MAMPEADRVFDSRIYGAARNPVAERVVGQGRTSSTATASTSASDANASGGS